MKKMTQEELIDILQEKVGKDISLSDHLEYDLGLDSLDMAEIVGAVDSKLGVEMSEEISRDIKTVQDIWDYIQANQEGV